MCRAVTPVSRSFPKGEHLSIGGEHEDIINQSRAFVDPPVINLIILERSDAFAADMNSSLIEVSKKKYSTVWSKQNKTLTAQDSETSSLQSNLTEGFDTVPTALSTQEFRHDLSGSQDTDSSLSGQERLIQQNMGEVQSRKWKLGPGACLWKSLTLLPV
ncbi:hypothetical protein HGM15179_014109, partial [Zosterops borbonicus]